MKNRKKHLHNYMCNDKIYSSFGKQVNPISNKDRRLSRSLFNKLTFLLKNHSVKSKQKQERLKIFGNILDTECSVLQCVQVELRMKIYYIKNELI